ncbi:hypothetical protein J7J81_02325, partial [bacterium]|nr:hypothetical protein [bacterium]
MSRIGLFFEDLILRWNNKPFLKFYKEVLEMGLREKIFGKLIKKYARKNPEKIVEYLIQHSQEVKSWIANHSQDIPGYLEEVAKWAREHPQTIEEFFSKEKEKIGGLLEEYAVEIEKIFGNQKVLNIFGKGIKA